MYVFIINLNGKSFRLSLEQYVAAQDLMSVIKSKSELELEFSFELERRMNNRG